jgi:thioredoxin-dependent peroxiredoxin
MLKTDEQAPDFSLNNEKGEKITLSDFKGKKIVLYFYPKDDTPGCTKEACGFRDIYDYILEAGAVVIGVSPDGQAPHIKFKEKYNLPFYLLSDESHKVSELYGAWGKKKMFGKSYLGIIRSTYLIGADFTIKKVFPKVSPEGHAEEVLESLGEV